MDQQNRKRPKIGKYHARIHAKNEIFRSSIYRWQVDQEEKLKKQTGTKERNLQQKKKIQKSLLNEST